ncbi:MAG TPA: haloacid dehalogenase, partial [Firmicutes bacterium]|nr:haloacid dehalogenase [Bacillota bacterium]
YGTMGELCAKPHPWIYSELALGLGIKDKEEAIILEDSSAGVISSKIAGYNVIGFDDGNLIESGLDKDCLRMISTFNDIDL